MALTLFASDSLFFHFILSTCFKHKLSAHVKKHLFFSQITETIIDAHSFHQDHRHFQLLVCIAVIKNDGDADRLAKDMRE